MGFLFLRDSSPQLSLLSSLEPFFEWPTQLSPLLSKTSQLSTLLSKSARLSPFLSAQMRKFSLESPFLSGFTLLSAQAQSEHKRIFSFSNFFPPFLSPFFFSSAKNIFFSKYFPSPSSGIGNPTFSYLLIFCPISIMDSQTFLAHLGLVFLSHQYITEQDKMWSLHSAFF